MLSWKVPLLFERTSSDQALISSGCMRRTPQAPNPPALATAMDSDGELAPAMGARRIGRRKPNRAQKLSARSNVMLIRKLLQLLDSRSTDVRQFGGTER